MSDDERPFHQQDSNATPLEHDEMEALLPSWITTRDQLNEAEQANILAAMLWTKRLRRRDILTEAFIRELHKKMFEDVWNWAGIYRITARNIGGPAWRIRSDIRDLLDDTTLWINSEIYAPDELAIRFHHRLVSIHPFPNGNGRHARLIADLLIMRLGAKQFTWGISLPAENVRLNYISSLQNADRGDITSLIEFARL